MHLSDYHTHSRLSFDTHAPPSRLAGVVADVSLDELYITNHFDFLDENGVPAEGYDWTPVVAQHQQAPLAVGERLTLKLGLELSMPRLNPAATAAICARSGADFILGPVYNLSSERGGTDLLFLDFSTVQACYDALNNYFASLALLVAIDFYDVLAHLIYLLRYMQVPVTLNRYQNAIRAILRMAMKKGRGMEANTCQGHILGERWPVLALYRDYGDEIVTIGSDAHIPADVGKGVRAACALLRERGFRRVCTYGKHQPVFHTLG